MAILFALLTVLATTLGGTLALRSHARLHLTLGLSAGLILGLVSFDLIPEVFHINTSEVMGVPAVTIGFVVGFMALHMLERLSGAHEPLDAEDHDHGHAHSATGLLGAAAMAGHVFLDGVAIGAAFQLSSGVGIAVAIAVIAHAFSDGLNTVTLLIHHGHWRSRAAWLLMIDAVARTSGATVGTYFTFSDRWLGLYLAMFAGFLVYLATSHILPEAHNRHSSRVTLAATFVGIIVMFFVVSAMKQLG